MSEHLIPWSGVGRRPVPGPGPCLSFLRVRTEGTAARSQSWSGTFYRLLESVHAGQRSACAHGDILSKALSCPGEAVEPGAQASLLREFSRWMGAGRGAGRLLSSRKRSNVTRPLDTQAPCGTERRWDWSGDGRETAMRSERMLSVGPVPGQGTCGNISGSPCSVSPGQDWEQQFPQGLLRLP